MALELPALFDRVNSVDASSATRRFQRRRLSAGEVVLAAGEPGDEVVGVVRGRLQVRAGDVVLAYVGPGDLVGELALFDRSHRTADVVAAELSEVLVITRAAYEELRDTAHPVAANLERVAMAHQAARLRQMDARIAEASEGSVRRTGLPGSAFFAQITAQFGRGGLFNPTQVDPAATLARSGLLGDVPEPILASLGRRFSVKACGPGHLLCTEGARGDALWLLESGEVEVLVSTGGDEVHPLATVGPGTLIGAAALVEGGVRMATCVARSRVVALVLDQAGWDELVDDATLRGSALRRAVIRALAAQLAGANQMLERADVAEARGRLAASSPPAP